MEKHVLKKVSIVVPIYNAESYLQRCLESICKQDYADLEILLINDGSTDNSEAICQKQAQLDDRIQYIYQSNSGVSVARNKGIEKCSGTYITFVDADDFLEQAHITHLVDAMLDGTELAICGYQKEIETFSALKQQILTRNEVINESLMGKIVCGYTWNKLFLSDLIKKNALHFNQDIAVGEDTEFVVTYCLMIQSAKIIPTASYHYRQHQQSALGKGLSIDNFENKVSHMYAIQNLLHLLVDEYPVEKAHLVRYLLIEGSQIYRFSVTNKVPEIEQQKLLHLLNEYKKWQFLKRMSGKHQVLIICNLNFPRVTQYAYQLLK